MGQLCGVLGALYTFRLLRNSLVRMHLSFHLAFGFVSVLSSSMPLCFFETNYIDKDFFCLEENSLSLIIMYICLTRFQFGCMNVFILYFLFWVRDSCFFFAHTFTTFQVFIPLVCDMILFHHHLRFIGCTFFR